MAEGLLFEIGTEELPSGDLTSAIERWSALHADIVRRPPVVPVADNYDRLFYEPDAIARSARYSHYIDEGHMLRTHTTAAIPALLSATRKDRLIVCPGLVYRRDVVDRLHVGEPHQIDIWIARRARLATSAATCTRQVMSSSDQIIFSTVFSFIFGQSASCVSW